MDTDIFLFPLPIKRTNPNTRSDIQDDHNAPKDVSKIPSQYHLLTFLYQPSPNCTCSVYQSKYKSNVLGLECRWLYMKSTQTIPVPPGLIQSQLSQEHPIISSSHYAVTPPKLHHRMMLSLFLPPHLLHAALCYPFVMAVSQIWGF